MRLEMCEGCTHCAECAAACCLEQTARLCDCGLVMCADHDCPDRCEETPC